MTITLPRRGLLQAGAGLAAAAALPARAAPGARFPRGFLWGTAISGHQSEGNNVNSDSWLLENLPNTVYRDPSGDACDSYHRYAQDLDIAHALGLNCYRFGIEWSRIEPEPGHFSRAELDHYARVLEGCAARGLKPIVSYNHFTVPRWFAMRGGWEAPDSPELFARYCERVTQALGPWIAMASPFNEANIHLLARTMRRGLPPEYMAKRRAMIAAAARATNSPNFSSILYADPDRIDANLLEAHRRAYQAIKAGPGHTQVGVTLSTQQFEAVGDRSIAAEQERATYGGWWEAVNASDFVGVQTYTRFRFDAKGMVAPGPGVEVTGAGYEYYPPALGYTIRLAHARTTKPIYVTETGIAADDDRRRIAWIDATVAQVGQCLAEGIDVRSYVYWSLLDNFEWSSGYSQHFGLVAVDHASFARTLKPSAHHFAQMIRAHRG